MSSAVVEEPTWRSRFRRLRRTFWKLVALLVISSGVLVGMGRLLAPHADRLRPELELMLSEALNQPVRIERIEASWPRLSPRIGLRGLEIGLEHAPLLDVDQAVLEVQLYNLLRPAHNTLELVVIGLELALQQDADGRWSWRLDGGGRLAEDWPRVVSAGDLLLRDSRVRILPYALPPLELAVPEVQLLRSADRVRVGLTALPLDGTGESLSVRLALQIDDGGLRRLDGYAESPDFALSRLALDSTAPSIDDLHAETRAWLRWVPDEGARLHAAVDLHSQSGTGLAGHQSSTLLVDGFLSADRLAVQVDAHAFDRPDVMLLDQLAYAEQLGTANRSRALVGDRVDLEFLHSLLNPWLHSLSGWPEHLGGQVFDLRLGLHPVSGPYIASGRFEQMALELSLSGAEPLALAITGLDAEIALAGDAVQFHVAGAPAVEFPLLYENPIELRAVSGRVDLRRNQLEFHGLTLDHVDTRLELYGHLWPNGEATWLDLLIDTPRLSTGDPPAWLPRRGIPSGTRRWLAEGLRSIEALEAATVLYGQPANWRERLPPGGLHSRIRFQGLELAYGRDWPIARDLGGELEFVSESMLGSSVAGRVAGVAIEAPRIAIEDTRDAEIELELVSRQAGASGLAALSGALPIEGVAGTLQQLEWAGDAEAEARVWLPVRRRDDWRLIGGIRFADAKVEVRPHGIRLEAIQGQLPFSRDGLGPSGLEARLAGQAVRLSLQSAFRPVFSLQVTGRMPIQGLLPVAWRDAQPDLLARLNGAADFDVRFAPVPFDDGPAMALRVASALQGVTLDLPPPLQKQGDVAWPFELVVPLDDALRPIRFRLDDRIQGNLLPGETRWQIGLGLGDFPDRTPVGEDFIVRGAMASFDAGRWLRLLRPGPGDSGRLDALDPPRSGWIDVQVGDLLVQDASLGAVDIALAREQSYWRLQMAGEQLRGSLRLPATPAADPTLVLDLDRLHWPATIEDPAAPPRPPMQTDPRRLPAMDMAIGDLRWGELALGTFRFQSHGESDGLVIEQVGIEGDDLRVSGNGRWQGTDDLPSTRMRLRMTSNDLGRTLTRAGYDLALSRGNAEIVLDGRWPGSPLDIALQRLDGRLEIGIEQGVIEDTGPGAGRLLGLVSLGSIPRRLRLDFTDVFGEGLAFDSVSGHFDLADGVAMTENLRIDAPAAEIRISGRTLLRQRRYDQVLRVRPGVGATLPIIGALAAGPVGAAAGVALEQIFQQSLKGATEVRYSVTGSFDAPQVEPLRVERGDDG